MNEPNAKDYADAKKRAAAAGDDTIISCGCCRGPAEDRCCCWNHQDTRYGIRPKICSRHEEAK